MRKNFLAAILFAVAFTLLAPPPAVASVSWSVSISYFHESLAPYGRWVVSEPYGEVWVPSGISSGWDPYWNGEWAWTDYGWTWVSYDRWGDIPCHYGTWVWVSSYGWAWEPGTVWAPAWVTWAWTDGYIGWAPVPSTFAISAYGYSGPAVVVAPTRYVFVPATQFVGTNVSTVSVPQTQNAGILSRAQKGTRFAVSGGIVRATADPPRSFVERVSGKRLASVGVGKLKARPTTLAAAHVSGRRIGVVAPARERSLAIAQAKGSTRQTKASRATRKREARAAVAPARSRTKSTRARVTRETRTRQRAASPARIRAGGNSRSGAVRPTSGTVRRHGTTTRRKEAVHTSRAHREAARSASTRRVSKRPEHTPRATARHATVYRHEHAAPPVSERHAAIKPAHAASASAPVSYHREASRRPAAPVSSPAMHGNSHAPAAAQASAPHAQVPSQSAAQAPKGKHKKERG